MKDYYYILGISKSASLSEIQQAYKKLSLKFHPKENGNDPFFVMHYGKIKEAYTVLSDDHKRFRYDKALGKELDTEVEQILEGPAPVIASFFASKKAVRKGDLLTISWEVLNAELVEINLIGTVASNGTQTIRLPEMDVTEEFLNLTLKATNNTSSKASTKNFALKNLTYSPQKAAIKQRQDGLLEESRQLKEGSPNELETESPNEMEASVKEASPSKKIRKKKTKSKQTRTPIKQSATSTTDRGSNRRGEQGIAYVLIAVMFFMIVLMLFAMHRMNPMF